MVYALVCGVVGSRLAFGSISHGFESEHRLFSHHSASAFSKLRSLVKCSLDDSVRRLLQFTQLAALDFYRKVLRTFSFWPRPHLDINDDNEQNSNDDGIVLRYPCSIKPLSTTLSANRALALARLSLYVRESDQ